MTRRESNTFIYLNLIVFIEGAVYFYFKYFQLVPTEYGERPHGYTSFLQHTHILFVPSLLVLFGYFLKIHILDKLNSGIKTKRVSGISMLIIFILMSISGYMLQFGYELDISNYIGSLHIITSALWLVILVWHVKNKGLKIK